MKWNKISSDFEPDGSYRDIYIHKATLDDWQAVIDAVRKEMPSFTFKTGGEQAEMPEDVSNLFNHGEGDFRSSLYIAFGTGTLNCHFFTEEEVEFDLDPRDMDAELLPPLIEFMTLLGTTVGKPVSLTHENMPEAEIMRYAPTTGRVDYVGPAFGQ